MQAKLVVIAGPTAVGKGTIVRKLRELDPKIELSVSATTRDPRPGEIDGVDYFFWSDKRFDEAVSARELLEHAVVHGDKRYGTPRRAVLDAIERGVTTLLEIDIQGARQVMSSMPEALSIFILPPSWDELVRRLQFRGTESFEQQAIRLETARVELAAVSAFDVSVINDDVDKCAAEVLHLIS